MSDEFNPSEGVRLNFCCGIKRASPKNLLLTRVIQDVDAFLMPGNNVTLLARTSKDNPFFTHRSPNYHSEGRFLEFEGNVLERIYRQVFDDESYGPKRGSVYVDFAGKFIRGVGEWESAIPQQQISSIAEVERELTDAYCLTFTLAEFQKQGLVSANKLERRNERLNLPSEHLDKLPDWLANFIESIRKINPSKINEIFCESMGGELRRD